jgi:hypothetical protein
MFGPNHFVQLPINPDGGLPQAFSCKIGHVGYDFCLYASLQVPNDDPPDTVYDLASPMGLTRAVTPGYLVLRIASPGPLGRQVVFMRNLVPEAWHVHYGGELAVKLTQARIARGNLAGPGQFGSRILLGAAPRWVYPPVS